MPDEKIKNASVRVQKFYETLCENVYGEEKHEIIRIMCICLIAREPLLLIGPPGTAKSMLVDNFCTLLGLNRNYDIVCKLKMELSETGEPDLQEFLGRLNQPPHTSSGRPILDGLLKQFSKLDPKTKAHLTEKLHNLNVELKKKKIKAEEKKDADNNREANRKNSNNAHTLGPILSVLDDPENGCCRGYFSYLLTQFTDPSEILGPINIPKLLGQLVTGIAGTSEKFIDLQRELIEKIEDGLVATSRYERITRSMLPRARVAFLDEIFRADSTILNALLTLINERKFYQPDGPKDAPLEILFGASNALPSDDELKAFVDRFPLRVYSRSFMEKDPGNDNDLNELLSAATKKEKKPAEDPGGHYMAQFKLLQDHLDEHVRHIDKHNKVRTEFLRLVSNIQSDFEMEISDRRLIKLFRLLCASALMNCHKDGGQTSPEREIPLTIEDLHIVKHCWNKIEDNRIDQLADEVDTYIKNKSMNI